MGKADRVRAYLGALDLRAITVRSTPAGPFSKLGFSTSFPSPGAKPPPDIVAEFWFAKPAHAELVTLRCRDDFKEIDVVRDGGWIDLPPTEVAHKIVTTARLLGAAWKPADAISKIATEAVADIERKVEAMRKAGDLAPLNASYRQFRLDRQSAGERAPGYSAFLGEFTTGMVRVIAANLSPVVREGFGRLTASDPAISGISFATILAQANQSE